MTKTQLFLLKFYLNHRDANFSRFETMSLQVIEVTEPGISDNSE